MLRTAGKKSQLALRVKKQNNQSGSKSTDGNSLEFFDQNTASQDLKTTINGIKKKTSNSGGDSNKATYRRFHSV